MGELDELRDKDYADQRKRPGIKSIEEKQIATEFQVNNDSENFNPSSPFLTLWREIQIAEHGPKRPRRAGDPRRGRLRPRGARARVDHGREEDVRAEMPQETSEGLNSTYSTPFFIRLWEIFRVFTFGTCYTFQQAGQATYCQSRFSAVPATPEFFALILIHKRMNNGVV